jgi:C4-dicarboxylate transporter DctM subunit
MLSLAVLGIIFCLLLVMGIPITFSLGLSSAAGLLMMGRPLSTVAISIFQGIESWVLLAIPPLSSPAFSWNGAGSAIASSTSPGPWWDGSGEV